MHFTYSYVHIHFDTFTSSCIGALHSHTCSHIHILLLYTPIYIHFLTTSNLSFICMHIISIQPIPHIQMCYLCASISFVLNILYNTKPYHASSSFLQIWQPPLPKVTTITFYSFPHTLLKFGSSCL